MWLRESITMVFLWELGFWEIFVKVGAKVKSLILKICKWVWVRESKVLGIFWSKGSFLKIDLVKVFEIKLFIFEIKVKLSISRSDTFWCSRGLFHRPRRAFQYQNWLFSRSWVLGFSPVFNAFILSYIFIMLIFEYRAKKKQYSIGENKNTWLTIVWK